jgi:hypothetical protein
MATTSPSRTNMKAHTLLLLLGLAACGGKLGEGSLGTDGTGGHTDGASGDGRTGSFGSEAGRKDGGASVADAGSGSDIGTTRSGDSGSTIDSTVTCVLPPESNNGGQCSFCKGQWYCPQPRSSEPECPSGVTEYAPCTESCIQCAPDGSVAYFSCTGVPTKSYSPVFRQGYACSM